MKQRWTRFTTRLRVDRVFRAFFGSAVLAAFSLIVIATNIETKISVNPGSRYATIDSLVHRGSFSIDERRFQTIDHVKLDGHVLSSKPPVLPVIGAGIYWVYTRLTGRDFGTHPRQAIWWVTGLIGLLSHGAFLWWYFQTLRLWLKREEDILVPFSCGALAYVGLGYSTSLNNHAPAAAALMGAFYLAYAIKKGVRKDGFSWAASGFLASLAVTLDLASVVVAGALFLYLLTVDARRTWVLFVASALVPVVFHFALTYAATGSFIPIYLRRELYAFEGSYWNRPTGYDSLHEPKWLYFLNMTVGHHGLFSLTPIFVFALIALVRELRNRKARTPETYLIAGSWVVLFIFLTKSTSNYGGACIGFRWFILFMPFILLYVARWWEQSATTSARRAIFGLCWTVSTFTAFNALRDPWRDSALTSVYQLLGLGSL